jgi:hypothetical protein
LRALRIFATILSFVVTLSGCGGGDSTTTTIIGSGVDSFGKSPPAILAFTQADNNLKVTVEAGPNSGFSLAPNANVMYATVTVCEPGNAVNCQTVDHVQVDTGSIGLRILASKVSGLNLPHVQTDVNVDAWECYPFVIGGLWGVNAVADVTLGRQTAPAIPIQIIQDSANSAMQVPADCDAVSNGQILNSQAALGSNGIIGIGSMTLDCGLVCQLGDYSGSTYAQYRGCPVGATNSSACLATAVPPNMQVYNPVAALPAAYNNGVILSLPATSAIGASTAEGELVLGITDAQIAAVPKVNVGVDYMNKPNSYLNITTQYNNQTIYNSYLDTGTNGLFFVNPSIPLCAGSFWYCPASDTVQSAVLSDGDFPNLNQTTVSFTVGSADSMFRTSNSAFGNLAGSPPGGSGSFSWGLPFFYGKKVFMSIWDQRGSVNGPWYSWGPL